MLVSSSEELWKRARELTKIVFEMTSERAFRSDWALRDQMRRSSVSIMSNVAEGFERGSRKEFARFLDIAKGSCGELRAQLYVAEDAGFSGTRNLDVMRRKSVECSPGCLRRSAETPAFRLDAFTSH